MTMLTMMRPYCNNTQLAVIVIALTRRLSQQPTVHTVLDAFLLLRDMWFYSGLFIFLIFEVNVKGKKMENVCVDHMVDVLLFRLNFYTKKNHVKKINVSFQPDAPILINFSFL